MFRLKVLNYTKMQKIGLSIVVEFKQGHNKLNALY